MTAWNGVLAGPGVVIVEHAWGLSWRLRSKEERHSVNCKCKQANRFACACVQCMKTLEIAGDKAEIPGEVCACAYMLHEVMTEKMTNLGKEGKRMINL
jgi:hypothetical protein